MLCISYINVSSNLSRNQKDCLPYYLFKHLIAQNELLQQNSKCTSILKYFMVKFVSALHSKKYRQGAGPTLVVDFHESCVRTKSQSSVQTKTHLLLKLQGLGREISNKRRMGLDREHRGWHLLARSHLPGTQCSLCLDRSDPWHLWMWPHRPLCTPLKETMASPSLSLAFSPFPAYSDS